jgi:hypothetical protein
MVTVEVDLDEETVRALSREAAQFEFRGSESYVRWLLDHRALVLAKSDAMAERLSTLEARLTALEGTGDESAGEPATGAEADPEDSVAAVSAADTGGEAVREVIDEWLVVAHEADDDDIEQAVATVEKQGERAPATPEEGLDGRNGEKPEEFVDETLDDEFDL